ncbi:MAG: diguanylate cyclase [Myxococcales bacterium]|nr:diguanylate cyclase [Myxococcales bacterium]HQY62240.1 GGDEF domain-containing protein [Polyangiaceae bacterium]
MKPRYHSTKRIPIPKQEGLTGAEPGGPPGRAYLVVLYGADLGKRVPLGEEPFFIGRSSECDLTLDQETISRRHTKISATAAGHEVEDLGSTNGTLVNDEPISRRGLENGDRIAIGRSILKYLTGDDVEAKYHEEIYRLMMTDALTGTYNRRFFNEACEAEVLRAKRYKRPLSLLMFDIDHFKRVNDQYGHIVGDSVLRQLAKLVKPKLRAGDIYARVGGEEFAILVPEVDLIGTRVVAEKLRAVVESAVFVVESATFGATISVGCATLAQDGTSEDLYRRADELLYAAKQGGRNRVVG